MTQISNQHEENDFAMKDMESRAVADKYKFTDLRPLTQFMPEARNTGYVSPYRAAYMQAHGLVG